MEIKRLLNIVSPLMYYHSTLINVIIISAIQIMFTIEKEVAVLFKRNFESNDHVS